MSNLYPLRIAWATLILAAMAASAAKSPPNVEAPGHAELAASINAFGSSLFDAVLTQGKPSDTGVFLSPFGVSQALGMLLNGASASGQSYTQLLSAVYGKQAGNGDGVDTINSGMKALADWLLKAAPADGNVTLTVANSAWLSEEFELQQEFEEAVSQHYSAVVEPLSTAEAVNRWVSNATRGKINEIVDEAVVEDAALLLINALDFRGRWETPFDKQKTKAGSFRLLSGGSIDVAMMQHDFDGDEGVDAKVALFSAPLASTANKSAGTSVPCVAVKLAYYSHQYAAYLAMPAGNVSHSTGGPPTVEPSALAYREALAACRAHLLKGLGGGSANLYFDLPSGMLKLKLPRFELGYETSLKAPLQLLGITQPFLGGDLTRMASSADSPPLLVDDVVHKVYFKVGEAGTEASAATAVLVMPTSLLIGRDTEITFDAPFTVVVAPEGSPLPLFVGEVFKPELWRNPSNI